MLRKLPVIFIVLAMIFAAFGGTASAGGKDDGKTHVKNLKPHVIIHYTHKNPDKTHGGPRGGGGGGEDTIDDHPGYNLLPGSWDDSAGAVTVSYVVDERFAPIGALDEIKASFATWDGESALDFSFAGTEVVDANAEIDADGADVSHNTVSFRQLIGSWTNALAVTILWFDDTGSPGWDSEAIEGIDILFNTKFTWGIDPDGEGPQKADIRGKYYDIRNVFTHEVGHVVGLAHYSGDSEATMYPSASAKETKKISLTEGDKGGAFFLYGAN